MGFIGPGIDRVSAINGALLMQANRAEGRVRPAPGVRGADRVGVHAHVAYAERAYEAGRRAGAQVLPGRRPHYGPERPGRRHVLRRGGRGGVIHDQRHGQTGPGEPDQEGRLLRRTRADHGQHPRRVRVRRGPRQTGVPGRQRVREDVGPVHGHNEAQHTELSK